MMQINKRDRACFEMAKEFGRYTVYSRDDIFRVLKTFPECISTDQIDGFVRGAIDRGEAHTIGFLHTAARLVGRYITHDQPQD